MSNTPLFDGDPSTHLREFRRCLGQFSTGVAVITAVVGGELIGMTVNSFASVSLSPPMILWSIDRSSRRLDQFTSAEQFNVNVLSDRQIGLSRNFSTPGVDKFRDIEWQAGNNGAPLLGGVAAFFECRSAGQFEGGDHIILLGKVERSAVFERGVLLFSQGRYRIPADHPDDTVMQGGQKTETAAAADDRSRILFNLFQANHRLSFEFGRYREGLTRDQHRVLVTLERRPDLDVDSVAQDSFMGIQTVEDALGVLVADGSVSADGARRYSLTERGRDRRRVLAHRQIEMERDLLKDIPSPVIEAGEALLARLAGH